MRERWAAARPLLERIFEITADGFDALTSDEHREVARLCREVEGALRPAPAAAR